LYELHKNDVYVEDPYIVEMRIKHLDVLKKAYDIACSQHCCERETRCPAFLYKQNGGIGRDGIKITWRCEHCVKAYKMDIIDNKKYLGGLDGYSITNLEQYLDCITTDKTHCGDKISGYHGM
jgi:hypothetical protein